ncbi:MAG: energy-coupling factor transporter transmembrane protein EcfT [Lachnospiraceae bacterium]|nr:energy-coupling factor transporter transmembrane protein EcfT [Lachnospiraceae bacterium]
MKDLFQYTAGDSVIHKLNPLTRILLAVAVCAAAFVSDNLYYLVGLLCFDMLLGLLAGVFGKALSLLKGLLKISIFLFILQILFVRKGNRVFWIITDQGLILAAKVVLRLMIACIPLALMLAVTQISDLANALVQVAHVPYKYAFTVTTAIRFIPQFMEEMADIMEAQTARGVEFDTKNGLKKIGMMLPLCVPLLVTSVRRTDAAAAAAEARGFELRNRTSGYKKYPFHWCDLLAVLVCAALIAGAVII